MIYDPSTVGIVALLGFLVLYGGIWLSRGRPDRACVDCKHYRPEDGTCHNPCPPERDLVLGVMHQRVVLAAKARAASSADDWCGYGAHRFEAKALKAAKP